jgi:transposase InsO family protein
LGQTKECKEKSDLELIRELVEKHHQKYGYRIITMKLQKERENGKRKIMNHKKVLRIMSKYNLLANIRRRNPYRLIQKATQEHRTAPNILNREFKTNIPYRKFGTDITYIPYKDRWSYLSVVKDMASTEILSWKISLSLGLDVVQQTLQRLESKYVNDELK